MKCPRCGKENLNEANFCKACGTPLTKDRQAGPVHENGKKMNDKPQRKRKLWIGAVCVLLCAVFLALAVILVNVKKEKEYESYIASGNRYIEQQNYKKAEDAYLKAIKIEPKKEEPYLCLADIYADREDYEKAVGILKKARKNTGSKEVKGESKEQESKQNQVEKKLDEFVNMTEYTWKVKPTIEADNIYYLKNNNIRQASVNEMNIQFGNEYAVIKNNESFGLIDMEGNRFEDEEYKSVSVDFDCYVIEYPEEKYDEELKAYTDLFFLIDGQLSYAMFYGGPLEESGGVYYWTDSLHNTMEASRVVSDYIMKEPSVPIPVRTSDHEIQSGENWMEWNDNLTGKYAIYYNGGLVSDFIYEQCGSYTDGLMAVCKDGKWGYVDKEGKVVIPLEYEASWNEYVPYGKTSTEEAQEYCYAVSEGYVPLVRDGKWELRNTAGKVVIPSGIFEAIRPVHAGKCWVKKSGKWGVIELQKENQGIDEEKDNKQEETITADTYINLYSPIIQEANVTYGSLNIYYFYDIDKDGVKELLVEEGTCEADYIYKIYTISGGKSECLGQVFGFHCAFYKDENNGTGDYIVRAEGHQGYERISNIRIIYDKVTEEQVSERKLGSDDRYYSEDHEPLPYSSVADLSLLQSGGQ